MIGGIHSLAGRRIATGLAATLGLWLLLAALAVAQPTFPSLSGRVVDQADLIPAAREAELTEQLAILEAETTDQLVVVTLSSLQGYEIEDYGYQLGRAWGIGQAGANNGVLLIVAPEERKVRIEVGYGLEPIMTDALSTLIIQNRILPEFRDGDYEAGITAGVDAIAEQLSLDPAEAEARAAAAAQEGQSDFPIGVVMLVIFGVGLILITVMAMLIKGAGGRRYRGGVSPIVVWAAAEALRSASRSSGGGSGWSSGGGGFSGGGGSFGGGGASGGW